MGAAKETALVNTSNRANTLASSATRALVVINYGKVVYKGYGAFGTALRALSASDATVCAVFANVSTLLVAVALNGNALGVLDEMNESVGADANANSATNALGGVDVSDAVFGNSYSRSGASLRAVAITKAGKDAESVT